MQGCAGIMRAVAWIHAVRYFRELVNRFISSKQLFNLVMRAIEYVGSRMKGSFHLDISVRGSCARC